MDEYFPSLDGHAPTTLPGATSASATALIVADPSVFDTPPVTAAIWAYPTDSYLDPEMEVVTISAITHNVLTVTRSVNGVTADHAAGAYIMQVPTPYDTAQITAVIGAPGLPAGGTVGQVLSKIDSDDGMAKWVNVTSLGGDVDGPASAVDGNFASFSGATGKIIKDSGKAATDFATAAHVHTGVYEPADADIQSHLASTSNPHAVTYTQAGAAASGHVHTGVYEPANANIQAHIGSTSNPHSVTAAQAGAEALGAVSSHAALQTGVHGIAITAAKTLTVQDNVTITGALGSAAYADNGDFAPAAEGVTNGDSHDHSGGDGAAIPLAGMADMATASLLGRATAGAGAPEVLSAADAKTLLGNVYIGTTAVALDRASAGLTLAGLTLTEPVLGVATATSINAGSPATPSSGYIYAKMFGAYVSGGYGQVKIGSWNDTPGNGSAFTMFRARGTYASPSYCNSGDSIAMWYFQSPDTGGIDRSGATIQVLVDGDPGATYVPMGFNFLTYASASDYATRFAISASGNIVCGKQAALATNATAGFLYIPTCAGTPSGTPTSYTGKCALVFDTTNNKLYIYDGGWVQVALSA